MIAKEYQSVLESKLSRAEYLLLTLVVGSLQLLKQVKLEILAEALPLPIEFESRRKKLRRFLRLPKLDIKTIWFDCLRELLKEIEKGTKEKRRYVALDRTNWGAINLLMVSLIYNQRAVPIYWEFLAKKGSSGLEEQKRVLEKVFELLPRERIVILGDREFCSVSLGKWLREKNIDFCLRQKKSTSVCLEDEFYREMRDLGLSPGTSLFFPGIKVTQGKGFGSFNLAGKWKKTYRGRKTKEPWFILTSFANVEMAIQAYQRRFDIEEMFRDFKSGGYNLEGSKLSIEYLSKLLIIVAIAYTSAMLQGQKIKQMGIQKYVARPEQYNNHQRRHSSFYVGQHLHHWLNLQQMFQKNIDELMQINRHRLKDYLKGQRAIQLALSTF
jgi:hypothetical protein